MKECGEYEALISAAVDGAVSEAERRELMGHLAQCAACREKYEQMMALHEAFAAWEAEEPPADLTAGVMEKIRRERKRSRRRRWQRMTLAAACLAVVVLGVQTVRRLPAESPVPDEDAGLAAYSAPDAVDSADEAAPKATLADSGDLQTDVTYFEACDETGGGQGEAEQAVSAVLTSSHQALLLWMEENGAEAGGESDGNRTWTISAQQLEQLEAYLQEAGAGYTLEGTPAEGGSVRVVYEDGAE